MSHYLYRCFSCQKEYAALDIEKNRHYLCPSCGRWEAKRPLRGVLWIIYDYHQIHRQITVQDFKRFPIGQPWYYPHLWPLHWNSQKNDPAWEGISAAFYPRLALPDNLLGQIQVEGNNFFYLDDTRNPTFSYKDRASILVAAKAMQLGITKIAAASTGNAGSSLAGICARLGLQCSIWVPETIPENKRLQIQAYGADIHLVKGDYDQVFDVCLEISEQMNWYNRNTAYNPLTVEGKKSAAYDLFIAFGAQIPDVILVPVGDGVIISGIYKGFWELKQLGWIEKFPRLIAVQAAGSDALVRYLSENEFTYSPAKTIADSICAGAPRNLMMAAQAVKETGGFAIRVSDQEILQAQQMLARQSGNLVEPAAAATLAGYLKAQEKLSGKILLLFTGLGLKDISSLHSWNKPLAARSAAEWKEYYRIK